MLRGSKPGEHRGGRKKGTPNKTTAAVKFALVKAFSELGDVAGLVNWAKKNKTEFYKLWAKLLPIELSGSSDSPLKVEIAVHVVDEPTAG